ncbi:MAG: PD40 domain-containing protein [Sphingomonadaceae bacterium]|nr:PD40 domain-containing protein [Sphingomonadaceae bacterium]
MIPFLLFAALLAGAPVADAEAGEPPVTAQPQAIADDPRPEQPPGRTLPLQPTRRFQFETHHGTWMSLDVAPDGKRIVFDILGDLYGMPASGGRATRITSGVPFDTQPTFSRDGRWIVFVSDRSGADNLWIVRPDGSGLRQVSFGDDDTALVSPAWSADGKAIFVSRCRADLNAYELWRYDLAGHGSLLVPIRASRDAPESGWLTSLGAVASPDGRYLYLARQVGGLGGSFEDVGEWTIVRRDLATGAERTIVAEPDGPRKAGNPGAAFRPALSPDGRWLAYGHRLDGQTELRLRDLATGADRRLAFPIEHDQLQALAWQDVLPRYAFTPDGKAILLSVRGRIERLPLDGGAATTLPLTAALDVPVGASTRQDIVEETGPVRARLIMAPTPSPDGKTLAFSALGRLYLMPLDGTSKPVAFAPGGDPAYMPSWSPDGRRLVWVSWSERGAGAVWTAPADGSSPPTRLSDLPEYYTYPVFTPDGKHVLAVRSGQQARLDLYMEYGHLSDAELVAIPAAGGAAQVVMCGRIGARPQFAGGRTYVFADDGLETVDLATGAHSLAVQVKGPGWYFQDGAVAVDDLRISPDGRWLLAQVAQQLHVVAMPDKAGATVDLTVPHLPHRRVTNGGADYFEWSTDGKTIGWSSGSTWHERPLADVQLLPPEQPGWSPDPMSPHDRAFTADVEFPRDVPAGRLLLRGGRVLTMQPGDRVIDRADILVEGDRFAAVGPEGSIAVPPGTPVRDVSGKIVTPGFIDTHDHIATIRRDVLGLEDWGFRARLAWGVTTSFDPSTLTIDMLPYQDLLDAGLMLGPRVRQTGVALFSMQRFGSLDDALAVIRRYRDDYRIRNIKEYRTGSRKVREWVAEACRELGMHPTTEGALSMKLDLTQIIDGIGGNEHALVASPLQEDVLQLMRFTRTSYTTTLEITNGGPSAQDWSIQQDDPHADPKVMRFWPQVAIDQYLVRRPWRTFDEYRFPSIAADAAAVQAEGGLVGIGSHGEAPGIGFHWEMEAHAKGGMSAAAILHAATIGSAETIGRKHDLGSIEPGKLADLVILDKDPTVDIHNARSVVEVMRGGRLYDAATLAEIAPDPKPAPKSWFDRGKQQWLPSASPPWKGGD